MPPFTAGRTRLHTPFSFRLARYNAEPAPYTVAIRLPEPIRDLLIGAMGDSPISAGSTRGSST
jgi:hypothetical protein